MPPGPRQARQRTFRKVAEAADGDAKEAWAGYADFIDASADAIEDPSKAADLATQAQSATEWLAAIGDSTATCS